MISKGWPKKVDRRPARPPEMPLAVRASHVAPSAPLLSSFMVTSLMRITWQYYEDRKKSEDDQTADLAVLSRVGASLDDNKKDGRSA